MTCKADQVGVARDTEEGKVVVRFPSSGKEEEPREDHHIRKKLLKASRQGV